ncbi:MAG: phenylalanine--tRNA ligase subunit beta, partial [Muribaculaceae bacterium]|nr:phenylalanine--tRNA ligase subunit beta [Muribaculaceae bacterium]
SVDSFKVDHEGDAIKVSVADAGDCPRYCGVTIRGVKVAESPDWLKERLTAIGQRPINNIVDITNYLLHAMGQPLHCFDVSKIDGGEIIVKTVAEGTKFTTLDGVERTLNDRDLMICNTREPMCMAGVFGGLDSGVTDDATSIFLESAYFNPTTIRKAARRHGLNTDSSFRYERGVDPNGCMYVLKLAALMVQQLAGGEICGPVVDIYPQEIKPFDVALPYAQVTSLIGKEIPQDEIDAILHSLEIEITDRRDGVAYLKVPTYRVDVQRPCDVIEDVLRIYGYNNVEFSNELHANLSFKTVTDTANQLKELISEQLTAQGFNEIMNNSLTARSYYDGNDVWPLSGCVELLNPLSNDLSVMRRTLLYGGLESLAHNINRKADDLMMYEFGNIYNFNPEAVSDAAKPLAPYSEGARLGLWLTGNIVPASWLAPAQKATIYHMRYLVEAILDRMCINRLEITITDEEIPGIY